LIRVSLGAAIRLQPCDEEVTGSSPKISLFICGAKVVHIYPSRPPH